MPTDQNQTTTQTTTTDSVDSGGTTDSTSAATVATTATASDTATAGQTENTDTTTSDDTSLAGGAGKKAEEDAAAAIIGAPETYDIKPPEGQTFDAEAFAVAEPVLREMNLSNEAAQKLVSVYAEKVLPMLVERAGKQAETSVNERAVTIRKEWAEAARADTEIGGAKFDETIDSVAKVWDRFGIKPDTGIRQILNESGIGNHPDMLRFLSRVGKAMGEGGFIPSDGNKGETLAPWDRAYGQPEPAKAD